MLNCLNSIGLDDARVVLLSQKSSNEISKITITISNKMLSEEKKIALHVASGYFDKFFKNNSSYIYTKAEKIVNQRKMSYNDDITDILVRLLESGFKKYFMESEIDILCDIEREKSPYYPNFYCSRISVI